MEKGNNINFLVKKSTCIDLNELPYFFSEMTSGINQQAGSEQLGKNWLFG